MLIDGKGRLWIRRPIEGFEMANLILGPMESLTQTSAQSEPPRIDPEHWVDEYGDLLFGFAAARVRDPAIAKDLVQETFLAAIKARGAFAGRSSERAWLFGILRNKLVDCYRRQSREITLTDLEAPFPEEEGAFGT